MNQIQTPKRPRTQQAHGVEQPPNDGSATPQGPAPTIAVRRSCSPDGIGLSHYVLMDDKKAK